MDNWGKTRIKHLDILLKSLIKSFLGDIMNFYLAMLLIFSTSVRAQSEAQSPSSQSADQFTDVYKKYWSQPVSNWDAISKEKANEIYIIQKKDTLSELSEVLFGTPNYWPKIWSLNDYIGNPHLIYPRNEIVFVHGQVGGKPPSVSIEEGSENGDGMMGSEEGIPEGSTVAALDRVQEFIPAEPFHVPVLNQLPPSFPIWQPLSSLDDSESLTVERQLSKLDTHIMKFPLDSFLSEGKVAAKGKVEAFLNANISFGGLFDTVYVKDMEGLELGRTYSVVKYQNKAKTSKGRSLSGVYIYEYIGEIKIKKAPAGRNKYYAGEITKSIDMVPEGAFLIEGEIPLYDLRYDPSLVKKVSAKLLRGNEFFGSSIYAVGQTVYLTNGSLKGLAEGNILQIKQNREARNPSADDLGIVNRIGLIKLVKVGNYVSTGIVVTSRDFMLPGDKSIR